MNQQVDKPWDDVEDIPVAKFEGLMEQLKLLRVSPQDLYAYAIGLDVEETNQEENDDEVQQESGKMVTMKDTYEGMLQSALEDSRDEVYDLYVQVEKILVKRELIEANE